MLTVRKVTPEDRGLLEEAAQADSFHVAAGIDAERWLDGNVLMWSDDEGPVVALKTTNVVRADVQFMTQDFERNRNALLEGFWRYVTILQQRGVKEIVFNTQSPRVSQFFCRRFHFRKASPGTYTLRID